ncbi:reverse transcriptase domain-containing protein [Tanacetum coccineum]
MEQYLVWVKEDIRPGVVKPKIGNDVEFEINSNFIRELRRKLFKGTDDEDAHEHVRRVLEIVDLFHFHGVTYDAVMPLKGPPLRWINRLSAGLVTTWDLLKKAFIRQYCPPFKTTKKLEIICNFKQEMDDTLYHAWEKYSDILYRCPQHDLNSQQEVHIFYTGLDISTHRMLNSRGFIPLMTPIQALKLIQVMAEHSHDWYDETTTRGRINDSSYNVYAIQASFKIAHLTKECPLKKEDKEVEHSNPYRTHQTIYAIGIPEEIEEDEGDMNDGYDITVKCCTKEEKLKEKRGWDQVSILTKDKGFGHEMHKSEESEAVYDVTTLKDYAVTYSNKEMSHHTLYDVKPLLLYAATFKFTRDDLSESALQRNIGDKGEIDNLTMEQYLALTRGNQAPGVVKPEIGGNVNFEIKSQFMRELREDTFSGNKNDDAHEHVDRLPPRTIDSWDLLKKPLSKGTVHHQRLPNSLKKSATLSRKETKHYTKLGNGIITFYINAPPMTSITIRRPTWILHTHGQSPTSWRKEAKLRGAYEQTPRGINRKKDRDGRIDLGANVNVIPKSIFKHLKLARLKKTNMLVEMADMTKRSPIGIVENVLVKIDKFLFPSDFVVMNMLNPHNETMILGRPFLATIHAEIDVFNKEISLGIRGDRVTFDMDKKIHNFTTPIGEIYMINVTSNTPSDASSRDEETNDVRNKNNSCNHEQGRSRKNPRKLEFDINLPSMHFCKSVKQILEGELKFWPTCDPNIKECNGGHEIYEMNKEGDLKKWYCYYDDDRKIFLDSYSCGSKVLSWFNRLGYAVTNIITA